MRGGAIFCFVLFVFLCSLLAGNYYCCVCSSECNDWFQWLFLAERGMGRNEHGVVVEWISAYVCLVSACSSSWYVLYLFVRFSFGLLSTCVTTGWIFEISLCKNSIQFKILVNWLISYWFIGWIIDQSIIFHTKFSIIVEIPFSRIFRPCLTPSELHVMFSY